MGCVTGHIQRTRRRLCARLLWLVCLLMPLFAATPALAANCSIATSQGSTGPSDWQTYCWIDFSTYNDAAARSAGGQPFSLTLQDGSQLSFVLKVTTPNALTAIPAPSWTGAAIGNTAFLGISGSPVLYQSNAGTSVISFTNITVSPPAGVSGVTAYMFVGADGESTNTSETLKFQTNGGNWIILDQAGPIAGSAYPAITGAGTTTFTESGVDGNVGAYIVGTNAPTTMTTTLVGGGLQGAMFALRFASIRLSTVISGARAAPADQFTFNIAGTSNGAVLATNTSSGSSLGPFTAAALSATSSIPVTLTQSIAAGSTTTLTHYQSSLSCTNLTSGSITTVPTNVMTTAYSFGAMQYGDQISCVYAETPYPHLTLAKALGASGRQFVADQFVMNVMQGATNVATTTTTGSGATIATGTTPLYQATAGTAYSFNEAASGTTILSQYTAGMACTNAASSTTTLPTTLGGSITPKLGDVVACIITNTKVAANALLTVTKSSVPLSDPVRGSTNPLLIPGAIVRYTFSVANTGPDRDRH